jgi:hypothetical protein
LGWATITHPFHPLRTQRFEVLKTRRVAGIDTLILRHPQLGSYTVAQEWTNWRVPDDSTWAGTSARKLDAALLLPLISWLTDVHERSQEGLDE